MKEPQKPEDFYLETVRLIQQDARRDSGEVDKIVLLISSGAIALSANFLADIIDNGVIFIWILFLGWFFLILSFLFYFLSFGASLKNLTCLMRKLDAWKNNGFSPPLFDPGDSVQGKVVYTYNFWTKIMLAIGICLMTIFFSINLRAINLKIMNKNLLPTSQNIDIGSSDQKAPINIIAPYREPVANPASPNPGTSSTATAPASK